MAYGTLSALDDLWTENGTVSAANEAAVAQRFQDALDIHNAAVEQMIGEMAYVTDKFLIPYGGTDTFDIIEVDQFGAADASKVTAAGNLGLPLRQFSGTLQWTRTYLETHSISALAKQLDAAATADILNIKKQIRKAIYNPLNNNGYIDVNMTNLTLPLKALLNADSTAIPVGLNGTVFDGTTHTHYLGSATFTAAALSSTLDTVIEHGLSGSPRIYIARVDEATVRGFAGFTLYTDARIVQSASTTYAAGTLDMSNPDDRAIGLFNGAEVSVKPWVFANYPVVFDLTNGEDKPLAIRTRSGTLSGLGAWGLIAENEAHPLRAQNFFREIGVGVANRHKAAALYTGNATYAAPAGL